MLTALKKAALVFLSLVPATAKAHGQSADNYGLTFLSHNVSAVDRTSLTLNEGKSYHFSQSVSIDMALKLRAGSGQPFFGNILTLSIGDKPIRLLITSQENFPAVTYGGNITLLGHEFAQDEWFKISLTYSTQQHALRVRYPGVDKQIPINAGTANELVVFFGANIEEPDIAPISVRDVEVATDGKRLHHWALNHHSDTISYDELSHAVASGHSPQPDMDKRQPCEMEMPLRKDFGGKRKRSFRCRTGRVLHRRERFSERLRREPYPQAEL